MSALMNTYSPLPVSFSHGRGAELFSSDGRSFLDGLSGIAVTNLGHAHPRVTAAITEQASKLLHCSNIYRIDLQERVGEELTRRADMERVFFSNSGAEANEAAIKLARLHAHQRGIEKPRIVVLEGAFHGRTLAALSATGNPKIQAGFGPLLDGFLRVPRNNLNALKELAEHHSDVAALMLEPVQGESGIHPLDLDYLRAAADLCKDKGWLLIFDEVQSGNGRTGSYFYYQQTDVTPDIVSTAKALGNGVPIGACLARGEAAQTFAPGHHGSTYGGNPLACAAAGAVLESLAREQLQDRAQPLGQLIESSFLAALKHQHAVQEFRRAGLMIGIELHADCGALVAQALEAGLLINVTAGRTIRLLPPLVMTDEQGRQLGESLATVVDHWLTNNPTMAVTREHSAFSNPSDLSPQELDALIDRAMELKVAHRAGEPSPQFPGSVMAMIFAKSSTRTRVSFESGMAQMGGHAMFLSPGDTQLGRGEPVEDSARVISSMVDIVMIRTFGHDIVERFAAHSSVPVINALTDDFHPCQLLADMQTYREHRGSIQGKTVCWLGDGNNMCHSYINAARQFDFQLRIACPKGFEPRADLVSANSDRVTVLHDAQDAVKDAALLVTDVWASMGQEEEQARRAAAMAPFQLNSSLLAAAAPDALYMHCLPAHRGEEISAELMDAADTVIWDEAENRLHAQKALIERLLLGTSAP